MFSGPYSTYSIDNSGPYAVTAQTYCRRIAVQENYDSDNPPTANLQQFNPDQSGPILVVLGSPAIFSACGDSRFYPGQIVGYINTVSGSITVAQAEGEQV